MDRGRKRLASRERAPAASEVGERIRFNRKGGRGRPQGFAKRNERLRQQTLTQIDFVSRIPVEGTDLELIGSEDPLEAHQQEDSAGVERADAKTSGEIAPLAEPTTPRKKRKLEIPSSHSPPDSPYSLDSKECLQKSMSPLVIREEKLLVKSASGLVGTPGDKLNSALVVGNSGSWEIGAIGDGVPLQLTSRLGGPDILEGIGAESPITAPNAMVEAIAFEEGAGEVIISCTEGDGKPLGETLKKSAHVLAKSVIRDSDEDSESDYEFGSETQAVVDNLNLAYLSESLPDNETPSPKRTYEVKSDSTPQMVSHADVAVTGCVKSGVNRGKQASLKPSTGIELYGAGSAVSSRACEHSDNDSCGTEDARIQPEGCNKPSHSRRSASPLGRYTADPGGTSRDTGDQSTSTSPPTHTSSPDSRPVSLDMWMDYIRSGQAREGVYEFESVSQLLPESLMNDSLPLPPDFSPDFSDEGDC